MEAQDMHIIGEIKYHNRTVTVISKMQRPLRGRKWLSANSCFKWGQVCG